MLAIETYLRFLTLDMILFKHGANAYNSIQALKSKLDKCTVEEEAGVLRELMDEKRTLLNEYLRLQELIKKDTLGELNAKT